MIPNIKPIEYKTYRRVPSVNIITCDAMAWWCGSSELKSTKGPGPWPLRTLEFRWSIPSRHRITCYYINTWVSSVGLIFSWFYIRHHFLYKVILYICNTTGTPCRCATPRMFLYLLWLFCNILFNYIVYCCADVLHWYSGMYLTINATRRKTMRGIHVELRLEIWSTADTVWDRLREVNI